MEPETVIVTATRPSRRWGLFTSSNEKAFVCDSVVSLDYNKEFSVPTYPMESGAFESYNKVEKPYMARLVVTKGGSRAEKKQFQDRLSELAASRELFKLETPEQTYANANIIKIDFQRNREKGADLITAELTIQEIRTTARQTFVNIAPIIDAGAVQAQDVPLEADIEGRPPQ